MSLIAVVPSSIKLKISNLSLIHVYPRIELRFRCIKLIFWRFQATISPTDAIAVHPCALTHRHWLVVCSQRVRSANAAARRLSSLVGPPRKAPKDCTPPAAPLPPSSPPLSPTQHSSDSPSSSPLASLAESSSIQPWTITTTEGSGRLVTASSVATSPTETDSLVDAAG